MKKREKTEAAKTRDAKLAVKEVWEQKFLEKIEGHHFRKKKEVVKRILRRIDTVRNGLIARSRKHEVECNVTTEELRQMIYDAYGTKCKYCDRILVIRLMVIDHIIPISKGGNSNRENLQVICKPSNTMKGSLDEESFYILLNWLKTIPEDLSKDIQIRLARGIR